MKTADALARRAFAVIDDLANMFIAGLIAGVTLVVMRSYGASGEFPAIVAGFLGARIYNRLCKGE